MPKTPSHVLHELDSNINGDRDKLEKEKKREETIQNMNLGLRKTFILYHGLLQLIVYVINFFSRAKVPSSIDKPKEINLI